MNLWLMAGVVYLVLLAWSTYKLKVYIPTVALFLLVAGIVFCLLGVFGTTTNVRLLGCLLAAVVLLTSLYSWVTFEPGVRNPPGNGFK